VVNFAYIAFIVILHCSLNGDGKCPIRARIPIWKTHAVLFLSHTSYYVVKLQRQGTPERLWSLGLSRRHVTLLYIIQVNVISVIPCILRVYPTRRW